MKKLKSILLVALMAVFAMSLAACTDDDWGGNGGNQTNTPNETLTGESNVLVTYFSWSSAGNTKTMAEYIAEFTGGEIFRIQPATPYTTDYNEVLNVARQEKANNARPELFENITAEQLAEYDVVFIGYPVWYYDAPMIIYSFLEANDFSGKTVVTFATSGGSGISDSNLKSTFSSITFLNGLCVRNINGSSARTDIRNWFSGLGVLENN